MTHYQNVLTRYNTINQCLGRSDREWTLNELFDKCNEVLDIGGHQKVSLRTIQKDIENMRNEFEAPIVVYNKKYYKYGDEDFTIADIPLTEKHMMVLQETFSILKQFNGFKLFEGVEGIMQKLEAKIYAEKSQTASVIHFDKNDQVKGLDFLEKIYQSISNKKILHIGYDSFNSKTEQKILFKPFILKEYTNRWFVVGKKIVDKKDGKIADQVITNLALDRIVNIEESSVSIYVNENFNPDEYYENVIGVTVKNKYEPNIIQLWISKNRAPYVITKPIHHTQEIIQKNEDGSMIIKVLLKFNLELDRILLGFGNDLVVISPEDLRFRIQEILRGASDRYTEINEHEYIDNSNI